MSFPIHSQVGAMLGYIAYANKRGVNKLASSQGYHVPPDKYESRFKFLQDFCSENPDTCFDHLVKIHPDADMIAEAIKERVTGEYVEPDEGFDSFVGDIVSGVSNIGAAAVGKIGKRGENKAAMEASKQESKSARFAAIAKAREEEAKSKSSSQKWIWIGLGSVVLILIGLFIFLKVKKII